MKKEALKGFTPKDQLRFLLPATLTSLATITLLVTEVGLSGNSITEGRILLIVGFAITASIYISAYYFFIIPSPRFTENYRWGNAIISGLSLGFLSAILPEQQIYYDFMLILAAITTAFSAGRIPTYLMILLSTLISIFSGSVWPTTSLPWVIKLSPTIISLVVGETILQLISIFQEHVTKLETINQFSREISASLNSKRVLSLLSTALRNAIQADTYIIGMTQGTDLKIEYLWDEGEIFKGQVEPLEGTLSGWVLKHGEGLFLPDLRRQIPLEGVEIHLIGKEKTNLSWIGVPMKAKNINGLIALGSYKPNAFDRTDFELLSNLAQQATLVLDNAARHAEVQHQSQIDSHTGVLNHGYFLKVLQKEAEKASRDFTSMSLIMLDIDYFKQYNDTYGHLVGDQILEALSSTIQHYVKSTDQVGRWGGEEFIIALPNTNGQQATQVAERIRDTMWSMLLPTTHGKTIPAPTVSQGIAIYPEEASEIYKLIDLADRRLYIAKERGRNQIEPEATYWDKLKTGNS